MLLYCVRVEQEAQLFRCTHACCVLPLKTCKDGQQRPISTPLQRIKCNRLSCATVHHPNLHLQEAAKQLLQSDYALLSLEPRLALLRCLTDFAFASELARAHLDARNEAFAQSRALGKPGFATNTFSVMQGPTGALHSSWGLQASKHTSPEQAAEHATGVKMLEEWVEWVEMQR